MEDRIISIFKQIGIPIALVIVVVAIALIVKNYYEVRLTQMQIKQIKRELGEAEGS